MSKIRLLELRDDKEAIQEAIDRTVLNMSERYDADVEESAEAIPSVVHAYLVSMVDQLNQHKAEGESVHLNFADLVIMGISHEKDDEAEKEGNFTPFITPGSRFESYVAGELADFIMPYNGEGIDLGDSSEVFGRIADRAKTYLLREHGVTYNARVTEMATITHEFIAALIEVLWENKVEDGTVEVDFARIFDIGIEGDGNGNYIAYLRPGQEFKLLVKDDNTTE